MPRFYSNVKTRLSNKGIKASAQEIRDLGTRLGISNDEASSELILDAVKMFEMQLQAPQGTQQEGDCKPVYSEPGKIADNTTTTALSTQQKNELVTSTSQALSIELNESEVLAIGESLVDSYNDFNDYLENVRFALTTYNQRRKELQLKSLQQLHQEVLSSVSDANQEVSESIDTTMTSIKQNVQQGGKKTLDNFRKSFSSLENCLNIF